MKSIKLTSKKRELFGRKVKRLRREGQIPANIFGKKIKSNAITLDLKEFEEVFKDAGETQIIDLSGSPVLVSNVSFDPVSDDILHVDFRQVDLTEKITAQVPVEVEGESPAEKQGLGTLVVQVDEVEVEALPTELPEKITIDVSGLEEVDQALYIKDLKVGSKAEIKADSETIVAKIEELRAEEVAPVVETPEEGEEGAEESAGAEAVADKGEEQTTEGEEKKEEAPKEEK